MINFGRDEEEKYVLAASWARFQEDFADELEAGNFVLDLKSEFGNFDMKEPITGGIHQNLKEWSEAKAASVLGKGTWAEAEVLENDMRNSLGGSRS